MQRILLIDDSADDAFLTKRALSKAGLQDGIRHIADPEQAVSYLAGTDNYVDRDKYPLPDVIFLDFKMPKINGAELLKWIKSQPHLGRVIVIMLTGVEDLKLTQLAYQLGAHSLLSKNATGEEVQKVVRVLSELAESDNGRMIAHP